MVTFDIKDLYVSIPIGETLEIANNLIMENNNEQVTKQINQLLDTILKQNYFAFDDNIYQPENGISMGSPISNTIAEIFLQDLKNKHLKQILDTHNIILYTRYVDDILIISNTKHITLEKIQNYLNRLHPNLTITPTIEDKNTINFLDLQLIRQPTGIEIDIYRKPTTIDTTINNTSNHPREHKMAAYRYLINRMLSLPLSKEKEKNGRKS